MSGKGNLNSRFQSFGSAPAKGAWKGINAALPKKRKKKALIWWIGGGSAIAASIMIAFSIVNPTKTNHSGVANQKVIENQDKRIESKPNKNNIQNLSNQILVDSITPKFNLKQDLNLSNEITATNNQALKKRNANGLNKEQNTVLHSDKEQVINEHEDDLAHKNVPKNTDSDIELSLMKGRDIELIVVETESLSLVSVEGINIKTSNWQIGGGLKSSMAIGKNLSSANWKNTIADINQENNGFVPVPAPNPNPGPDNKDSITYRKVNQLISVNVFGRYNLTRRLFAQMGLDMNYLNAEHLFKYPDFRSSTHFFSFGADLKLGFKIIDKRRWEIDLACGLSLEKLFRKALLIDKKNPLFVWGPTAEFGINYHVNENISFRLSPHYGKILGKSNHFFYKQFQKKTNIGIGLSLLKRW